MTMDVTGPSGVPDLRLHLLEMWREGGPFDTAFNEQALRARMRGHRTSAFKPERLWALDHLKRALLFWVSEEMVAVIEAVAAGLPLDVRPEDVPTRWPLDTTCGLVVFERAVVGTDSTVPDHAVPVDAVLWGQTTLAEEPALFAKARRCVSIGSYQRVDLDDVSGEDEAFARYAEQALPPGVGWKRMTGLAWSALGRSDWPLGDELETPISEVDSDAYKQSCFEDRRLLAAFLLVIDQEASALADVEDHRPDRPTRRRSERKGYVARVNVVYLRRSHREPGEGGHGERRVGKDFSYVVQAHPRWQACGPHWSERRLITVRPHTKGEGPLRPPRDTVRSVIR